MLMIVQSENCNGKSSQRSWLAHELGGCWLLLIVRPVPARVRFASISFCFQEQFKALHCRWMDHTSRSTTAVIYYIYKVLCKSTYDQVAYLYIHQVVTRLFVFSNQIKPGYSSTPTVLHKCAKGPCPRSPSMYCVVHQSTHDLCAAAVR
jgi:hypothetical protein